MLKVDSIEELDDLASFHFIIMSDNKGDSPDTNALFARMVNWTQESGATFAIGLGDHVWRLRPENQFVKFVNSNDWWNSHFYPNIADGENGFYGKNQADWGTGGKLFDELELQNRSNIVIRDNNCEYYALLHVGDYTIHLIQLHYPDEPYDPIVAFKEDSRNYLMETLANIEKRDKDMIIVGAHSYFGSWTEVLNPRRKREVLEKCDLLLAATTHRFDRNIDEGFEKSGALNINTGSITHTSGRIYGYIEVHVIENPFSFVVQYIDASNDKRELQRDLQYVHAKIIGGPIFQPPFAD
jgi:hypothetical protein